MARLPVSGQDNGTWGDILNGYLSEAHNSDGSLKDGSVKGTTIAGTIPQDKISNLTVDLADKVTASSLSAVASSGSYTDLADKPTIPTQASDIGAASLANPTFTGVVTVPTPTNATDATTKDYVDTQTSSKLSNITGLVTAGTNVTISGSGTSGSPYNVSATAGSSPDATTSAKGIVQLAGDLAGTSALPTVPGLSSKIGTSLIGVAGGVASLDSGVKVPIAQIPSLAISNVSGLQTALDNAGNGSAALNILDYGAVGDGVTDCSAAFLAVMTAAKNARRTMPDSLGADAVGSVSIYIPPGDYLITENNGLMGRETMTTKIWGLRFFGEGNAISNIIFKPAAAGDCCLNDYWMNLQFQNLGFYAATTGCTFLHTNTTHSAQRYEFINCSFNKFKYNFYLEGDNNNSEYAFINCHTTFMEDNGAWLKVPSATGSDQFLNYWFYGCTFWSTNSPLIDMAKGGHVKIYGLDASDWGPGLSAKQYLIKLTGDNHASGVCSFEAHGLRVEAKNANCALLYSEWPQGNISFDQLDWSSQAWLYTYGDTINIKYNNVNGAIYTFSNSILAGGVNVAFAINDWSCSHKITFDNCNWLQKNSPSNVVTYDTSGAGGNVYHLPPVEFNRCVGPETNILGASGAAVWDCTIGYNGELLQSLTPRCVSIRSVYGTPAGSDIPKVILPVGALITGIEAISPTGAVSEGDGGTWTVATTDVAPVTIGSVTVADAMSAGFSVSSALSTPFLCSTAAKATITVTPTNVTQYNLQALVMIKGYW